MEPFACPVCRLRSEPPAVTCPRCKADLGELAALHAAASALRAAERPALRRLARLLWPD